MIEYEIEEKPVLEMLHVVNMAKRVAGMVDCTHVGITRQRLWIESENSKTKVTDSERCKKEEGLNK
jgi:hypothetical protein